MARFVVAAICGGVVGLFKTFAISDSASISPLAIAFLVGYAADVFSSFLDSSSRHSTAAVLRRRTPEARGRNPDARRR